MVEAVDGESPEPCESLIGEGTPSWREQAVCALSLQLEGLEFSLLVTS